MDLPTVLNTEELDCRSCGACCKAHPGYQEKDWVPVYLVDVERMSTEEKEKYLLEISPNKFAIKLTTNRRCTALSGEIGSCVSCEIYNNRPGVCRNFEKGASECHCARWQVGLGFLSTPF